jgi:hypothetical protein
MGFKSHIKKILCYPFKLKYLNQKVFYPILKKHNFFSWEHRVYIPMGFKSHIWKKKKKGLDRVSSRSPGSRVDPLGRPGLTGSLHWPVFWQTRTGPTPRSAGSWVDTPSRFEFNNYASNHSFETQTGPAGRPRPKTGLGLSKNSLGSWPGEIRSTWNSGDASKPGWNPTSLYIDIKLHLFVLLKSQNDEDE